MIRYGSSFRLHAHDIERLYRLTGVRPWKVETVDEWNAFIQQQISMIDDSTDEGRLIRLLLADERISM